MKRVVVFAGYYLPGYKAGGPIPSISRIIDANIDIDFRVVTRDHDWSDDTAYPGIVCRNWTQVGAANVGYIGNRLRDALWVLSELRKNPPDAYYINSLFSFAFSLLPLVAMKTHLVPRCALFLAPRGETSPGALKQSSLKKRLARRVIRRLIPTTTTWHTSTHEEKEFLCLWWGKEMPSDHQFVICIDPPIAPSAMNWQPATNDVPLIVFASRIDRMKGLDEAIRILSRIPGPFKFQVHGAVGDNEYWNDCIELANKILPKDSFKYMGSYKPEQMQVFLNEARMLLLPTKGENFGHVIAEALAVGCPCVVTDETPWTPILEKGAGHVIRETEEITNYIVEVLTEGSSLTEGRRSNVIQTYSEWYEASPNQRSIFASLFKE